MKTTLTLGAAALTVAFATTAQATPFGALTVVGPTGANTAFAPVGINASGQVAGTVTNTSAGTPVVTGFVTGPGGTAGQSIAVAGSNVVLGGLNDAGTVAGTIQPPSGDVQTFTQVAGGARVTTYTGAISATLSGINATGAVTGTVGTQGFVATGGVTTAFNAAAPGDGTTPTGINAAGTVVGNAIVGGVSTPFTRAASGIVTLLPVGTGDAFAYGINDAGAIVGDASLNPANFGDAFLLQGAALTVLDDPGAVLTHANAVNDLGEVVGYYLDASLTQHGYIYQDGTFYTVDFPGSAASALIAIGNNGDFVGSTGAGVAFTGATVPAPALLAPFGAAALAARRRRAVR